MTAPAPAPTANPPAGSPASRVLVGGLVAAAFALLTWADAAGFAGAAPGWWLLPVAAAVAAGGAVEAGRLAAAAGIGPAPGPLVPCLTAAVAVSTAIGSQAFAARGTAAPVGAIGWAAVTLGMALGILFAVEVARYRVRGGGLPRLAAGLLVVSALGLPLAFMVGLRLVCVENLGPEQRGPGHLGVLPLVSLVAVVKAADIAAYAVGSLVGRRRMAPLLSPGKTWEGAAAGLAAALATAWLVLRLPGAAPGPWGGWPVYGALVGGAGIVGDLAESLVKRDLGVKDSGRSLGGLGGVLDLVDSLLGAAPVAWLLWVLGRWPAG